MSRPQWIRRRSAAALAAGGLATVALTVTTVATLGGFTASITNTGDVAGTGSLVLSEVVTPATAAGNNPQQPMTTCLSTGAGTSTATNSNTTCTADKFGSLTNAKPGDSSSSTVVLKDVGSISASTLTMQTAGTCTPTANTAASPNGAGTTYSGGDTAAGAAGFCGKVDITVEDDTAGTGVLARCVYPVATGACPALSSTTTLATFAAAYSAAPLSILPLTGGTTAPNGTRTYVFNVGIDSNATNADQGLAANVPITFTYGQ